MARVVPKSAGTELANHGPDIGPVGKFNKGAII